MVNVYKPLSSPAQGLHPVTVCCSPIQLPGPSALLPFPGLCWVQGSSCVPLSALYLQSPPTLCDFPFLPTPVNTPLTPNKTWCVFSLSAFASLLWGRGHCGCLSAEKCWQGAFLFLPPVICFRLRKGFLGHIGHCGGCGSAPVGTPGIRKTSKGGDQVQSWNWFLYGKTENIIKIKIKPVLKKPAPGVSTSCLWPSRGIRPQPQGSRRVRVFCASSSPILSPSLTPQWGPREEPNLGRGAGTQGPVTQRGRLGVCTQPQSSWPVVWAWAGPFLVWAQWGWAC